MKFSKTRSKQDFSFESFTFEEISPISMSIGLTAKALSAKSNY